MQTDLLLACRLSLQEAWKVIFCIVHNRIPFATIYYNRNLNYLRGSEVDNIHVSKASAINSQQPEAQKPGWKILYRVKSLILDDLFIYLLGFIDYLRCCFVLSQTSNPSITPFHQEAPI